MHKHKTLVETLALFSSFSTLICCALPALLVALGAGAALAGAVSAVPQITWISEHKPAVFIFAGCMLTLSGVLRYKTRGAPCPTDPQLAHACQSTRKASGRVYKASLALYATGFFFAFIAPNL